MAKLIDRRRILDSSGHAFGYDAILDKSRRQAPRTTIRDEDTVLKVGNRRKLTATTQDVARNFAIAGWMIRKHLDYVSNFVFQARTGIDALDDRIEDLVSWWGDAANCDVAGRHSLARIVRMAEERRTVDGDVFLLKLSSGKIQAIEGDRVQTPALIRDLPAGIKPEDFVHGIKITKTGKATEYCICRREGSSGYGFDKIIPARYVIPFGYYTRFDQIRGVSPLASAINTLQDCYEGFDYALAKMKVAQMFGLVFYREAVESAGTIDEIDTDGDGTDDSYEVDFGRGPVQLDLDPGDRAEFLESRTPSTETQTFAQTMIAIAMKALDLPYSFYDESFTNFYGSRAALLGYLQSAQIKRADVRAVLEDLTKWRLGLWVLNGTLELPAGMTVDDIGFEWIHRGSPWWNPKVEVDADLAAIEGSLTTRADVLKLQGKDFYEVADQLAAEEQYLIEVRKRRGLPVPSSSPARESGNENDNETAN